VAEQNIMEPSAVPDVDHHHQLLLADVRCISAIRYTRLDFSESSLSTEEMEMVIQAIQSQAITPADQAIGSLTRRKLRSLSTWEQWRAGEHKQLDHFHDLKMHGEPVRKPPGAIVLRPHWQHSIKQDGTRRSRNCCDGSPRSAPLLHALLQHIHLVLNNPYSNFSLLSQHVKITESMEAMLKMLMHTLRHLRLPLLYPLTTTMQTGMNTISRRS